MDLSYIAFSERGMKLAESIAEELGGQVSRCNAECPLSKWTQAHFNRDAGLIFVGAIGIAVRAIAPYIKKKDQDPAVVVVDERGIHAISLLSGHLGGANALTLQVAEAIGAEPVITTATDVNGAFAVDVWSGKINAKILETGKIKLISSAILEGRDVNLYSPWVVKGNAPEKLQISDRANCQICLDVFRDDSDGDDCLHLIPKIGVLGIGCRKNASLEQIESSFQEFLQESNIYGESICQVVSIDLKKDEKGIWDFCSRRGLPFTTYSAEELSKLEGQFTESEFVRKTTGVGSVCERSAVYAGADLKVKKFSCNGVTFAYGIKDYDPQWS